MMRAVPSASDKAFIRKLRKRGMSRETAREQKAAENCAWQWLAERAALAYANWLASRRGISPPKNTSPFCVWGYPASPHSGATLNHRSPRKTEPADWEPRICAVAWHYTESERDYGSAWSSWTKKPVGDAVVRVDIPYWDWVPCAPEESVAP